MSAYLLTGTIGDPSLPLALLPHLSSPDQTWTIPAPIMGWVGWGSLWQEYAAATQAGASSVIVYPGSVADAVTDETVVADWAKDWRLPLLLTLPVTEQSWPLAVAFVGLAAARHAQVRALVLVGALPPWQSMLQRLLQTPVWVLDQGSLIRDDQ